MKKHSFLAGMLTMALIVGLGMSALAAAGQVSFNASALTLNGTQVSAKGENYTLANGQSVPASITYTDEKGGGTTYLPVRRISELLGVETGWDGAAGAVTVKGEVKTPETTTPPADYSDWSAEDEAAYQEFKGLWKIGDNAKDGVDGATIRACYVGPLGKEQFVSRIEEIGIEHFNKMANRHCQEVIAAYSQSNINFGYSYPCDGMEVSIGGSLVKSSGSLTGAKICLELSNIKMSLQLQSS